MEFSLNIKGLDQLEAVLNDQIPREAAAMLRQIERKAAQPIKAEAEATAPFDASLPGPHLNENIKIVSTIGDGEVTLRIGPGQQTFWGMFQEFGTHDQPAQHWLQRAFDNSIGKATQVIQDEINRMLGRLGK